MKSAKRVLMYGLPKSLLFKIILFLLILLFGKNVFAQDFSVGSTITAPTCTNSSNCSGGHYTALENWEYGSQNVYSVGSRYTGRLSTVRFNIPLPSTWPDGSCFSEGDLVYTLTLNMATNDWRNHFATPFISNSSSGTNWATGGINFISRKKISFNFKIPANDSQCYDFLYVYLQSTNQSNVYITGDSNWNLSSVVLTANFPGESSGSSGGSSGGSTSATNQDIINNNNNNTQSIINNNNTNTNNIIENNNNNTQSIIDNNNENTNKITDSIDNGLSKKCSNLFDPSKTSTCTFQNGSDNTGNCSSFIIDTSISGGYVQFNSSANWNGFHTDYMPVNQYTTYYLSFYNNQNSNSNQINVCSKINLYNSRKEFISQDLYCSSDYRFSRSVYTPYNASYARISLESSVPVNYCTFANINFSSVNNFCVYGSSTSKLDDTTDAINDVNDTLNNSNIDNGVGSDFFNNFSTTDNGGISGIITKPLTLINSLLSNNNKCSNLTFGIKFPSTDNKNVSFPSGCILWDNVPSTVVTIYHTIIVGFFSYYLLKRLFKDVEDLKNPEKDSVEVIDL